MVKIKAYTLIEILVVMAIFLSLSIAILPVSLDLISKNRAQAASQAITLELFLQQQKSYSNTNNSIYGVEFGSNWYKSYIISNTDNSETSTQYNLENGTSINQINLTNGTHRIQFSSNTIYPSSYGSISINYGSENYIITINSEGLLNNFKQ